MLKQPLKTVGVFFNREPYEDGSLYAKHSKLQFRRYLHELASKFVKHGYRMVILCKEDSYVGANIFSHYWTPDAKVGYFSKIDDMIQVDVIFDKGHFSKNDGSMFVINDHKLSKLGRNKLSQYKLFENFMPITRLLQKKQTIDVLGFDNFSKIVIKPLDQNGGRGVKVVDIKDVEGISFEKVMVVQEFIESVRGVPYLVEGRHDLRTYIINGNIATASLRVPKEGGYISNTHLGGSITFFNKDKLPQELIKMVKEIDLKIEEYGNRYYSADFIYDGKKWFLLEINDRPGVPGHYQGPQADILQDELVELIISKKV